MFDWVKKIISRVDHYAAHCYGRRQSYLPLGTFFAVDGLLNGALKTTLKPILKGTTPALFTFAFYLYSFFDKAKETYDSHPDNIDLELEHEKLRDTTEMILGKLQNDKATAQAYLDSLDLGSEAIDCLFSRGEEDSTPACFAVFHKIHEKIHPHQASYLNSFKAAVLHALTHVNEYLLLRYFADLNLLSFEEGGSAGNALGVSILAIAILSGYQTYSFCNKPTIPSSSEILEAITTDFRLFRKGRNNDNLLLSRSDRGLQLSEEDGEGIKLLAGYNATQKCYLGCK